MDMTAQAQKAIDAAIGDVNLTLRKEEPPLTPDPALVLVGEGGRLDSLGLVNFVLALERRLAEVSGRQISVIDLLTSADGIPFDTLGSLRDLLARKLQES
jgi:acyl carrier protein